MAVTGRMNKRKSLETNGELTEQMLKKIKVAPSADRPLPRKSALKKADAAENKEQPAVLDTATKAAARARKTATPKDEVAAKVSVINKTKKSKAPSKDAPKSKETKSAVKPVSKKEIVEKELVESDDEEDAQGTTLTPDQTAALIAGFESSDEEDDNEDDGIPLSKIPKAPVVEAQANAAADAAQMLTSKNTDPESTPGVIYIGRVPHGFYEKQMKAYFSQFGDITHLRLARNKKTRRSMHYAFIEFASSAVADIVVKTMDKYLMFNHILQVRRVPREQVKENMWQGEGKRMRPKPLNRIEGAKLSRGTDKDGWEKRIKRENNRRVKNAAKLAQIGYVFDAPVIKGLEEDEVHGKPLAASKEPAVSHEEMTPRNTSNTSKKRSVIAGDAIRRGKKTKTTA